MSSIWQDSTTRAKGVFLGCTGIAALLLTFAPVWDATADAAIVGADFTPKTGATSQQVTFTGLTECKDTPLVFDVVLEIDTQADGDLDAAARSFRADGIYAMLAPPEHDFLAGNASAGPAYDVKVFCVTEEDGTDVLSDVVFEDGFTYQRAATTTTTTASSTTTTSAPTTTTTTGGSTTTTDGSTTTLPECTPDTTIPGTPETTSTTACATTTTSGGPTSTVDGNPTTTAGPTTTVDDDGTTSTTGATTTTAASGCIVGDTTPTIGQTISVACGGFAPASAVAVDLLSTPLRLVTLTANATGQVVGSVTIPLNATAGAHEVRFTGTASDRSALVRSVPVNVSRQLPRTGEETWTMLRYGLLLFGVGLLATGRTQLLAARDEPASSCPES